MSRVYSAKLYRMLGQDIGERVVVECSQRGRPPQALMVDGYSRDRVIDLAAYWPRLGDQPQCQ